MYFSKVMFFIQPRVRSERKCSLEQSVRPTTLQLYLSLKCAHLVLQQQSSIGSYLIKR